MRIFAPVAAAGLLASLAHGHAAAQTTGTAEQQSFWSRVTLEAPVFTRHTPHDSAFNDQNWGLLADVALTPHWSLVGGAFRNSYRRNTAIAAVSWEPVSVRIAQARLAAGALAAIDLNGGYRPYNTADPFLGAFNLRLTHADPDPERPLTRLGLLVTVIPPAPKHGATAVNVALTYRLQ